MSCTSPAGPLRAAPATSTGSMQRTTIEDAGRRAEESIEHLLRRAGFGASLEEIDAYQKLRVSGSVDRLLDFEDIPDDVDDFIGRPGYVGRNRRRRIPAGVEHRARPPALAVSDGALTAAAPGEDGALLAQPFRDGVFEDCGIAGGRRGRALHGGEAGRGSRRREGTDRGASGISRWATSATCSSRWRRMSRCWSGSTAGTNVRLRPQENFARELMELFTMGVGTFAESDVYAAARVFTGWNLAATRRNGYYTFNYVAGQHDTTAKEFTFPIYAGGGKTIPARSADAGMQDGIDLINAVARHPATGPRLATQAVSLLRQRDRRPGPAADRRHGPAVLLQQLRDQADGAATCCGRREFYAPRARYARYSWPVEFVARAIKEVGWAGFSRQRRADPARQHGAAAVRAARRQRLGPGSWLVHERRDAGADELRRARSPPTSSSTCATGCAARRRRRRRWSR